MSPTWCTDPPEADWEIPHTVLISTKDVKVTVFCVIIVVMVRS